MTPSHDPVRRGLSRRGFLLGAGAGAAAAAPLTWLGTRAWDHFTAPAAVAQAAAADDGMPGPFPGRVVEVNHTGALTSDHKINDGAVRGMVNRGLGALTGVSLPREPDEVIAVDCWRKFFQKGDVVGIKVNPVGRAYRSGQTPAISSPALVVEVVEGLKSAGIPTKDIVLFERYADQFRQAGYEQLTRTRPLDGVRWYAAAAQYDDRQTDIEGYDRGQDRDRHVVGYDPDVFVPMGFAAVDHDGKEDRRDDRRLRSHLTVVVSRMVNKVINLPVLKDHGSAGVTLALKNLSHGLNNNVARSHLPRVDRGTATSGPNQCNTFIPAAVNQPPIRQKTVLHILDG